MRSLGRTRANFWEGFCIGLEFLEVKTYVISNNLSD